MTAEVLSPEEVESLCHAAVRGGRALTLQFFAGINLPAFQAKQPAAVFDAYTNAISGAVIGELVNLRGADAMRAELECMLAHWEPIVNPTAAQPGNFH